MTELTPSPSSPAPLRRRACSAPRAPQRRRRQAGPASIATGSARYELTALYDGVWYRRSTTSSSATPRFADVRRALADAFMPADKLRDAVHDAAGQHRQRSSCCSTPAPAARSRRPRATLGDNLAAAGIDPKAIDIIVISHFHPDHINGIKTKDNELVFPNAEIMVPEPEWAYWMDDANMNAAPADVEADLPQRAAHLLRHRQERDALRSRARKSRPASSPCRRPATRRATPCSRSSPATQQLMVLSDTAQHPAVFARHPDWQAAFDIDGADGGRHAQENARPRRRRPHAGHRLSLPVPRLRPHRKTASGYEHVPVMWQPTL